jgi:hypothetical protein
LNQVGFWHEFACQINQLFLFIEPFAALDINADKELNLGSSQNSTTRFPSGQ